MPARKNTWEINFKRLSDFYNKHKNSNPSNFNDKKLCSLAQRLRQKYKNGLLSQEQINQLKSIAFIFSGSKNYKENLDIQWLKQFYKLKLYLEKNPLDKYLELLLKKDKHLYNWISKQRSYYKKGILDREKISKLTTINFIWDLHEIKWQQKLHELKKFKAIHGEYPTVCRHTKYKTLARWIEMQLLSYKQRKLPENRVVELKKLRII